MTLAETRWCWRFAFWPVRTQEGRLAWLRWVQQKTFSAPVCGTWSVYRTTDFTCRDCGAECAIKPPNARAVCPKCCPDHDYRYESGEGHQCRLCGDPPPYDWYL